MFLFLKTILLLVGYSTACAGAGGVTLYGLKKISRQSIVVSAGTELATAFILGQGVLASVWLLLAVKGWFIARLIAAIILLVTIGGLYVLRQRLVDFRYQLLDIWRDLRSESWIWQIFAFVTIILILLWGTSLGRTMAGDAGAYYMALSKVVAHARELIMIPGYESFAAVGIQGEMHHAALISLHSMDAAQLFAWPTSIAAGVMLLAIGRWIGMGRRGQWIALMMMYTSSVVIAMSGSGKVDVYAFALGLAAYYWVLQIYKGSSLLALWLTGLLLGFAAIAKMSYAPSMGVSIILLFTWGYWKYYSKEDSFSENLKQFIFSGLHVSLGVLIAIIPHLLKNNFLFDNPLAPFGMDSQSWTNQVWFSPETTRRIHLSYPFVLTYGSYWAQGGQLSPLILAFLPLAVFVKCPRVWWRSPVVALTFAAVFGTVGWLILRPSVISLRYILATLMLFSLIPAKAAEHISQSEKSPRWLTTSVLVSALLVSYAIVVVMLGEVFFPAKTYKYLTGQLGICGRDYQYCGQLNLLNRKADQGDRILFGTYQRYWLRSDLLQCLSTIDDEGKIFSAPVEDRWLKIYQQGFRYLLGDKITHKHFVENLDFEHIPEWMEVEDISNDGHIFVYRLDYIAPPDDQQIVCQRRENSKVWEVTSP